MKDTGAVFSDTSAMSLTVHLKKKKKVHRLEVWKSRKLDLEVS